MIQKKAVMLGTLTSSSRADMRLTLAMHAVGQVGDSYGFALRLLESAFLPENGDESIGVTVTESMFFL